MKKLKSSLAAKATAVFLLIAMTLVAAGTITATVILVGNDSYLDNGARIHNSLFSAVVRDALTDLEPLADMLARSDNQMGDESIAAYYQDVYSEENSNLCIRITDSDGKVRFSNRAYENYRPNTEQIREYCVETVQSEKTRTKEFGSIQQMYDYMNDVPEECYIVDYTESSDGSVTAEISVLTRQLTILTAHAAVMQNLDAHDACLRAENLADKLLWMCDFLLPLAIVSLCLAAALFVFLLCAAGHKAGVEGIHLNWVDRIPLDLYLAIVALLCVGSFALLDAWAYSSWEYVLRFGLAGIWLFLLLSPILSFATRAKAGKWWRNTITFYVLRFAWRVLCKLGRGIRYILLHLPIVWRTALVSVGIALLELIFLAGYHTAAFWFVEKLLLIPLVLLAAINLRRLQKGGEAIAEGDMNYRVNTRHLLPVFRRHGENLNSIGNGMKKALDVQMRSERMKAELITNVSHDIKTPLTSIVNYVDLLKTAGLDSPQAPEYLEVLDRQSARLKKLTEDLIEASKASTGNIAVHAEKTDVNVLIAQAAGEYEEKFKARALEPVLEFRVQEPCVWADGRLLWRVLDNLMGNICKYSLEHTRVYVQTQAQDGQLRITFKNISREPLNISEEELMERFVRGDASRNTEGSGLGLSIARSLTELMGGSFALSIDGDLFKAQLSFPLMNQ